MIREVASPWLTGQSFNLPDEDCLLVSSASSTNKEPCVYTMWVSRCNSTSSICESEKRVHVQALALQPGFRNHRFASSSVSDLNSSSDNLGKTSLRYLAWSLEICTADSAEEALVSRNVRNSERRSMTELQRDIFAN